MRPLDAYGVLTAVSSDAGLRFSTSGRSALNVRLSPALQMTRRLFADGRARSNAPDAGDGLYLVQFDDFAHYSVRSVVFGRRVGATPLVELVPDPYFYFSNGFDPLRRLAEEGGLPPWSERSDILFWRGRGTHNGWSASGERIRALRQVPRIELALRLRRNRNADVGLTGAWSHPASEDEAVAYLQRKRIYRERVPMVDHARYKYQLDIDGVANAWATMERFLCGSCVLKVDTPFEMWFYDAIQPWRHFVPLRADFADVDEKLDWCLSNPGQAQAIAETGQAFAIAHTYEVAVDAAIGAFARSRIR